MNNSSSSDTVRRHFEGVHQLGPWAPCISDCIMRSHILSTDTHTQTQRHVHTMLGCLSVCHMPSLWTLLPEKYKVYQLLFNLCSFQYCVVAVLGKYEFVTVFWALLSCRLSPHFPNNDHLTLFTCSLLHFLPDTAPNY